MAPFGALDGALKKFSAFGALDGAFGAFGALDGAFGALDGAFGGFGAPTLIPVWAIWERCGGGWSGVLAVSRPSLILKTVLRNNRGHAY